MRHRALYLHSVWQLTAKLQPMSFIPHFTGISAAAISSSILVSFLVKTLVHIRSNGRAFSRIGRCLSRIAMMGNGRSASGSRSVRYVESSYVVLTVI